MDGVAVVRFTPELSRWEPERFVNAVIADWLHAAEVWVGANFLFGRDRSGNFSLLRQLGLQLAFRAEKIDPVRYKEFVVSSTRVRRLVSEGRIDEAAALLGHPFSVDGQVIRGDGRGRTLGFPTANLQTSNELLPPPGVYATTAVVDGAARASITNVGVRPTFGGDPAPGIETHIFDFDREVYGAAVRLSFVLRLRDERRFENVEALRAQITADCERARSLFQRISL
jgi:riboflavin kinase/FMN adenylyltransferase